MDTMNIIDLHCDTLIKLHEQDCGLEDVQGHIDLDALRRGGIDVPVLMLTARGSLDDRVRGLNMGADYYLPKPFAMGVRIEQLQEKINLSQYGMQNVHLPPADYKLVQHYAGKPVPIQTELCNSAAKTHLATQCLNPAPEVLNHLQKHIRSHMGLGIIQNILLGTGGDELL